MPRGIPRTKTEQTRDNVVKAKEGNTAQLLMDILDKLKKRFETQLIDMIVTHPVSDLEEIQRDYKACLKISKELSAIIAEGKIAVDKLNKEEN